MRKIVLFIASSLDGYIAREDGGIGWLSADADYGCQKFCGSIDTVLAGRKTYEQAEGFEEYPFAGKRVCVFTRQTGLKGDGKAEFVSGPVEFAKRLVEDPGKDIWLVGGGKVASVFLENGLIMAYRFSAAQGNRLTLGL